MSLFGTYVFQTLTQYIEHIHQGGGIRDPLKGLAHMKAGPEISKQSDYKQNPVNYIPVSQTSVFCRQLEKSNNKEEKQKNNNWSGCFRICNMESERTSLVHQTCKKVAERMRQRESWAGCVHLEFKRHLAKGH